jgi:hypothetical protein
VSKKRKNSDSENESDSNSQEEEEEEDDYETERNNLSSNRELITRDGSVGAFGNNNSHPADGNSMINHDQGIKVSNPL